MSSKKLTENTLAQRIHRARRLSGLSHDKIGEVVGCSGPYIASLEAGRSTNPRRLMREAIENWLQQWEPARASGVCEDGPRDYKEDAAELVAAELRSRPMDIEWVRYLLRILKDGGPGRRHGIIENIKAFIDSIEKEVSDQAAQGIQDAEGGEKVNISTRG